MEVRGAVKRYPGVEALRRVDFTIQPAEIVGLVGKNGAGKSSLIKILAGVEQPDEGTLTVDGTPVPSGYAPHIAHRLGLSFVHQELGNFPLLTVAENVAIGTRFPRRLGVFVNERELRRRVQAVLAQLESSIDPAAHLAHLTAVEQRLVMIARALYHDARVLVLDEPSVSLTIDEIAHLHAIVAAVQGARTQRRLCLPSAARGGCPHGPRCRHAGWRGDSRAAHERDRRAGARQGNRGRRSRSVRAPARQHLPGTRQDRSCASSVSAATRRQGGVLRAPRRRDPRARRARRLGTDGAGAPALRRRRADRRVDRGRRPARAPAQPGRRDRPRDRAPAGGPAARGSRARVQHPGEHHARLPPPAATPPARADAEPREGAGGGRPR